MMQSTNRLILGLTLAALALSGAAQARGNHDPGVVRHDKPRAEQCSENHHALGYGATHRIDVRQHRQAHRIRDGWRSGEITHGEARQLYRQQARIARMERRFGADGHLDRRELKRLNHALDQAGRKIHRTKHNDRYRDRDGYPPIWYDWS